jgi:hypothetical protein
MAGAAAVASGLTNCVGAAETDRLIPGRPSENIHGFSALYYPYNFPTSSITKARPALASS